MEGIIDDIGYLGKLSTYRVRIDDNTIVEITSPNLSRPKDGSLALDWDDEVYLSWDASSVVVLTK
jgi:putrescine transport system ATP-binding protein